MQAASLDVEENDYSLCYYEQYTVKPIRKVPVNEQSSSILTSICLDNNEFLDPIVVDDDKEPIIPSDSSIIESELFFQEYENETADFNFTKVNELVDDPVVFENKTDLYSRSKSEKTLDELSYHSLNVPIKKGATNPTPANNGETESVKHKLTNLWNNVKYGWASYLKKPAKISFENGPIYILGKRYNSNNQYERSISDITSSSAVSMGSVSKPESLPFDFVDANKLGSLNESYISIPASKPSSIPVNKPIQEYIYPDRHGFSINSNDFLSLASSPPSSKNNKTDYYMVDELSTSLVNQSIKSPKSASVTDFIQLQYLNPQKTNLEQEIHSRLWFTYRKDFKALNGNLKYTSDCGWGCMIRSAQMLIAQGLLQHYFRKDWSLYNKLKSNEYNLYKEIIALFNDRESKSCPFGIHRLLEIADRKQIGNGNLESSISGSSNVSNKSKSSENSSRVGSWFGPTSVCLLMKEAINEFSQNPILSPLKIYVAQDCTIYKQDVIDLCLEKKANYGEIVEGDGGRFKPCIILISVRLGGDELNDIYTPSLKMFLQMDICIGLIGGKPKHSLYFIGYQGDKIIYLDPHYCQPTVNIYSSNEQTITTTSSSSSLTSSKNSYDDAIISDYEIFDNSTFHCENPSKTPFSKLDPSLAIGFLCSSMDDLNNLCDLVKKISSSDKIFPIFGVNDESFEKSQLKCQMLCDELTDSIISSPTPQKSTTPSIPIKGKGVNLKNFSSPKSTSSSSRSLNGFMQSLPQKLERLKFENNEKRAGKIVSPKKSSSYLTEKFMRTKQNKKKSESDDFVLI